MPSEPYYSDWESRCHFNGMPMVAVNAFLRAFMLEYRRQPTPEDISGVTDEQLMSLRWVGPRTVAVLRERFPYSGEDE